MRCRIVLLVATLTLAACDPPEHTGSSTAAIASSTLHGLLGEYFDSTDLTSRVLTRVDSQVDFVLQAASPAPELPPDRFSVRWTGRLTPRFTEAYTFHTVSDDGVRLWVDGVQLIGDWSDHSDREDTGTLSLTAGKAVDVRVEFYEDLGWATARLLWSSPSQPLEVIPTSQLAPPLVTVRYEAEAAQTNLPTETRWPNYSGASYLCCWDQAGQSVTFRVHADLAGPATLAFRYSAGNGPASRTLGVNGNAQGLAFWATADWNTWGVVSASVALMAGDNDVTLSFDASSSNFINLDSLDVTSVGLAPAPPTPGPPLPPGGSNSLGDVGDIGIIPHDSGVFNVRAYGAVGDGVHDDSAAIQAALNDAWRVAWRNVYVYFPDGTYLVSSPIRYRDAGGNWHGYTALLGQSEAHTIIKLKDNTFTTLGGCADPNLSPSANKTSPCYANAVIYTASESSQLWPIPSTGYTPTPSGDGGDSYLNHILSLTIDTGRGNPGAVAIRWNNNNVAAIRHVTLRSGDGQGIAGLDLRVDYPGPGLVKNLTVDGFQYGVLATSYQTNETFEHVVLRNQRSAGIYNRNFSLAIRDLQSTSSVPAVVSTGNAMTVLVGGNLTGGAPGSAAIRSDASAVLYARDVVIGGYALAVSRAGASLAPNAWGEYPSSSAVSLFPSPAHSLNLPVEETPDFIDHDPDHWVNVQSLGCAPGDNNGGPDCAPALQRAIDQAATTGKTTIYLPRGRYWLRSTVVIRGAVRRLLGFGAVLLTPAAAGTLSPFRFDTTDASVTLERVDGIDDRFARVQLANNQPVILKDLLHLSFETVPGRGTGTVYAEEIGPSYFDHQKAFVRQLDSETFGTHVRNNGGTLWILGLKNEGFGTILETTGGGATEDLGQWTSMQAPQFWNGTLQPPQFICTECRHSLIFADDGVWNTVVQETRNGVTRTMTAPSFSTKAGGTAAPLYVGAPN